MATDQAAVQKFAEGDLDALSVGLSNPGRLVWINQQFRLNTAHAKILSLMLAFNGPIDIMTGQAIDVSKALHYSNSKEFHHFFPRAWLADKKHEPARRINSLSNFIMLTASSNKIITNRPPSDYLKQVESELGNNLRSALERNLISDEAYSAALQDDYDGSLQARSKTISMRAAELAGW